MIMQLFPRKSGFINSISYPQYFISQAKLVGNLELRVLSCGANVSHADESPIPQSRGLSLNPHLLLRTGIHVMSFGGQGLMVLGAVRRASLPPLGQLFFN